MTKIEKITLFLSAISILLSIGALYFTKQQVDISREQTQMLRTNNEPSLDLKHTDKSFILYNNGSGIAIIEEISIILDGIPMKSKDSIENKTGSHCGFSWLEKGIKIRVGEENTILCFEEEKTINGYLKLRYKSTYGKKYSETYSLINN